MQMIRLVWERRDRVGRLMPILLMLVILLIGAGVRWHQLGAQSLWYDEGVAYGHSQRTLGAMIPLLQDNVHVPVYFGTLALWENVVGASEFSLRYLSALLGVLAIAWTYALGVRLYGQVAGLAGALFVALNTFAIYYGQEARMYAMLSAIAVTSFWLFAGFERAVRQQEWRRMGVYALAMALVNALGMYTHFSYALVMVSQGVLWVLWLMGGLYGAWRHRIRQDDPHALERIRWGLGAYVGLNLLTVALFLPWMSVALRQVGAQPNISEALIWEEMARLLQGWLTIGITFEDNVGGMGVVVYFFALFGLLIPAHMVGRPGTWWRMLLPIVWVLASVGIYWYLGLYERYLRFLLPAQIGAALWMGRGAWILWHFRTRERGAPIRYLPRFVAFFAVGAFGYTLANGLSPLYHAEAYQRDDYRGMVADITRRIGADDALVLSAPGLMEIVGYYYEGDALVYPVPLTDAPADEMRTIVDAHEHLFVVLYGNAEQDPDGVVIGTLNQEAYPISDVWYGDVRLLRYATPRDLPTTLPLNASFGDAITLVDAGISQTRLRPGQVIQVQLRWQTSQALDARYKVFVQVLNAEGFLVAQRDSEPNNNTALTSLWTVGETINDNHAILLPDDLTAGDYRLIVGMYDSQPPHERLVMPDGADYLEIATLDISFFGDCCRLVLDDPSDAPSSDAP